MSRTLSKVISTVVLALVAIAFAPQLSSAGVILQGAASSPQGSFGGGAPFVIENAGNQSGLSAGYTSGVTDFDTFVPGTTHASPLGSNSGFTGQAGLPQQYTFDLGSVFLVDALAFWSVDNSGSVTQFELFSDSDGDFGNGGLTSLGTFNPVADAGGAGSIAASQVFGFGATLTQFFHLEALNSARGTDVFPGIGEVAFRSADALPEPATLSIFALGLVGLGLAARRSRLG